MSRPMLLSWEEIPEYEAGHGAITVLIRTGQADGTVETTLTVQEYNTLIQGLNEEPLVDHDSYQIYAYDLEIHEHSGDIRYFRCKMYFAKEARIG